MCVIQVLNQLFHLKKKKTIKQFYNNKEALCARVVKKYIGTQRKQMALFGWYLNNNNNNNSNVWPVSLDVTFKTTRPKSAALWGLFLHNNHIIAVKRLA